MTSNFVVSSPEQLRHDAETAEELKQGPFANDFRWAADEIERLTKALRIAELKASGTLANNLCPDHRDKQTGRPCLACEIERLQADNLAVAHLILANDRAGAVKWATGLVHLFGVEHGRVTVETTPSLQAEMLAMLKRIATFPIGEAIPGSEIDALIARASVETAGCQQDPLHGPNAQGLSENGRAEP